MRATTTALIVLAAAYALDTWTDWNSPTWLWALLTVVAVACVTTDVALAAVTRRKEQR